MGKDARPQKAQRSMAATSPAIRRRRRVALAVSCVALLLTGAACMAQASGGGSVSASISAKHGAVSASFGGARGAKRSVSKAVAVRTAVRPAQIRLADLCSRLSSATVRRIAIGWWKGTYRAPKLWLAGVRWWIRSCSKNPQRPLAPTGDTSSPQTSIISSPAATTPSRTASFSFGSSEAGSSFACSLDGNAWESCSSPKTLGGLATGRHSFSVLAIDAAGNVDPAAATRSWSVLPSAGDTAAPQTSITNGPPATTTATSASFSFASSEAGSSFVCSLDNSAWASCSSPKAYAGLGVGTHGFRVRAIDAADNVDATPLGYSWTVVSAASAPPPPPPPPPPPAGDCSSTVASAASAQAAINSAASGAVICLADGSYGELSLSPAKPVTLQAANPGKATVAGASLGGRGGITLARFRLTGEVDVQPGSAGASIEHNFFDLNAYSGFGVVACPSSTTSCDDISIIGNRFAGESEEDAIRANRYHDTADADAYGLLVEGNEFTGNVEKGDHNDVFQSVWVGDHLVFRKNFLHDFGGQGFFVKDQASAIDGLTAEDNLIVDQDSPCRPASLCPGFQLSPFQIFGPLRNVSIRHNTVGFGRGGGTAVLTGSFANAAFSDNVFDILSVTDSGGTGTSTAGSGSTRCTGNGWAAPAGTAADCSPAFLNPANDDYRLANGRGVDWVPGAQHYGP